MLRAFHGWQVWAIREERLRGIGLRLGTLVMPWDPLAETDMCRAFLSWKTVVVRGEVVGVEGEDSIVPLLEEEVIVDDGLITHQPPPPLSAPPGWHELWQQLLPGQPPPPLTAPPGWHGDWPPQPPAQPLLHGPVPPPPLTRPPGWHGPWPQQCRTGSSVDLWIAA